MSPPTTLAPQRLRPTASPVARLVTAPRRKVRFALLGHAPALDGLRGLAVILVVVFHFAGHHVLLGGWAGVDIFFCLSGFLITALILDERRVHGRLHLGRFYARRACRLLPALLLLLAVWSVVLLVFHDRTWLATTPGSKGGRLIDVPRAFASLGLAVVYLANWNVIAGNMEAPLAHLWSLAVEEQFYLLWPSMLLALLLLRSRTRLIIVGMMLAVSAALPWLYWQGGAGQNRVYFGSDTRAVGLLAGAFAALVWHERHTLGRLTRYGGARALAGLVFVLVIASYLGNEPIKFLAMPALLGLAVSQIVPHLAETQGLLSRVFATRALVWAGKRSYGMYLWHYVWATWTQQLGLWPAIPLGVAGTLLCTQLSWVLVESPALRYGQRFRVSTAPAAAERAELHVAA
ncbi:MAG: acyltransferase [Frankiales bacterium]|nr:acyltransferase [Frankiales bacterium]